MTSKRTFWLLSVGWLLALLALPSLAEAAPRNRTEVTAVVFAHDGQTLLTCGLDGHLRLWDVGKGSEKTKIMVDKEGLYDLALSADGKMLATAGGDKRVRLWDRASLKELHTLEGHESEVVAVAFSPDGKWVASGGYDSTVRVWDTQTGKQRHLLKGHEKKVTAVAFSPDGKLLASGGIVPAEMGGFRGSTQGDQIRLWDPAEGKEIGKLAQRGHRVAFLVGTRTLASSGMYLNFNPVRGGFSLDGGTRIALWDTARQREKFKLEEHWTALALSSDGRYLASGWGTRLHMGGIVIKGSPTKGIHLWELATGKEILQIPVAKTESAVLAFSPEGTRVVAGCEDGSVKFHDLTPRNWKAPTELSAKNWEKAWEALAQKDTTAAYEAVWALSAVRDATIKALQTRLRPVAAIDEARVRKLVKDLEDDSFKVREEATAELTKLGWLAEPTLQRALQDKPSPEMRKRVEELISSLPEELSTTDSLREDRALLVLERINTKEARELLQRLSQGATGAPITRAAKDALQRLAKRPIRGS